MSAKPVNELRDGDIDAPLRFSNRSLAQFAFSGTHPYVLSFARIAAVDYIPSTAGERIINHCLTNLPVYVAADDKLQFGWNENYLSRNLSLHKYEYQHLLLISALAECLPEVYVAAVLSHLSDKYEHGSIIKPSIDLWTGCVRSMNGILTTSEFALMVDERMRLDPYRVTSGHSTSCSNSLIPPADFARALQALTDLSLAGTGELTLAGGNTLGWFAAFSELFLGLNIRIAARDGHELYSTTTSSKATLHLIFQDETNLDLNTSLQSMDLKKHSLSVVCAHDASAHTIPRIPFTGRVGWEALLPKVFGNSFHRLAHQDAKCLVQSIGGCARLFELLVEEPDAPKDLISEENRLNPASWGMGLIQTLCNWFPEMRHLQGRLERIQKLDRVATQAKCSEGAMTFAALCNCTICVQHYYSEDRDEILQSGTDSGKQPESFCLLAIMETIVNLGLALSRITVVPSVYPSRAGVLAIYQRQVRKLLRAKETVLEKKMYGRMNTLFLNDWNANYSVRLQTAAALFSGSWPQGDLPDNLCALRHEGICAYVMDVQYGEKSSKQRRDKDVIRVLGGHVAHNQRVFCRVTSGPPKGIDIADHSWEEVTVSHLSQKLYFK